MKPSYMDLADHVLSKFSADDQKLMETAYKEAAVVCRAIADGDCSMMRSSGFSVPIPETGLVPYNGEPDIAPVNVISSAFGFGGNCVSLIFSKV